MIQSREDLEALREGWDFEAKRARGREGRGEVPRAFWDTYSAMANTRGGVVVLGLRQRQDGRLELSGLGEPERVERELWDQLQTPEVASVNLLGEDDVELCEVEGHHLLVIRVPRAERALRPVYVHGDMWSGTYVRVHEGDRHVSRERVRRMLADAVYDSRDDRVLEHYGPADLDAESLRVYRIRFQNRSPDHPWNGLADEDFLRQLGALRLDRDTGVEGLTVAGLLMFGRYQAIREVLQHVFLDYQEREDGAPTIEWVDRITPDGTWSGNLFDFYRRVVPRITDRLRVPFQLDPELFRRDETHVHEALREALVNCLIHADYEGITSTLVVRTPSGFSFRNPGGLRMSVERIRQGGQSDCRNRTLQGMFTQVGLGERAGSGFSRILRAWREQHWQVPVLDEDVEIDATVLRLSTASLLPDEVIQALEAQFGATFGQLDEVARLTVATARMEGRVTNQRMQEISDTHPRDLTHLLRGLVDQGFLEAHGDRRGAWYTVRGVERTPEDAEGDLMEPEGLVEGPSLPRSDSSLPRSGPSLPQSDSSLPQSDSSLPQSSPSLPQSGLGWSEGGIDPVIERVARTKWAPKEEVRAALLALCAEYRTIPQLVESIGRKEKTVRNYVRELVRENLLERRYPDRPSNPNQAYRTIVHGEEESP